jgi:hypothetical protein
MKGAHTWIVVQINANDANPTAALCQVDGLVYDQADIVGAVRIHALVAARIDAAVDARGLAFQDLCYRIALGEIDWDGADGVRFGETRGDVVDIVDFACAAEERGVGDKEADGTYGVLINCFSCLDMEEGRRR